MNDWFHTYNENILLSLRSEPGLLGRFYPLGSAELHASASAIKMLVEIHASGGSPAG